MLPEIPTYIFPPTPLMQLQDTYINNKLFVSVFSYKRSFFMPLVLWAGTSKS